MNYQKQILFPNPVWTTVLDDVNTVDIKQLITELRSESEGRVLSNLGGWQSQDIIKWNGEFLKLLKNINDSVQEYVQILGIEKVFFSNVWANVNFKGNSNGVHDHKKSIVSGAFYVSIPDKNMGDLIFHRDDFSRYFLPEETAWTDFSANIITFTPQEKLLVLFPSWLRHGVGINYSEQERISISFNFGLEPSIISEILDETI